MEAPQFFVVNAKGLLNAAAFATHMTPILTLLHTMSSMPTTLAMVQTSHAVFAIMSTGIMTAQMSKQVHDTTHCMTPRAYR